MEFDPKTKPRLWNLKTGITAYNCKKAGMPHPVGAWPFWERAGNRVMDYSGHGNHGIFGGNIPVWAPEGLNFPSISEWVDISHQDLTSNWTIVFEAYCNGGASPNGAMVVGDGANMQNFIYTGHNVRARFSNSAGSYANWSADADFFHKWRTCAFVADATGIEFYLDSIAQGRQVITPLFKFYQIGTGHTTSAYDYNGIIKYMYLFNTALTAAQIKFLHTDPYFMYRIPEELYGYVAEVGGVAPTGVFYGPLYGPFMGAIG